MRRLTRSETGVANRWARGVAFMWVLLVGFPLMFFGLAMAVDIGRIVIADRQVSTATHAAALAAAYQFNPGKATINATKARAAAVETMCVARSQGALKLSSQTSKGAAGCVYGGGSVSAQVTMLNSTSVRVTSTYRVEGLLLLKYFSAGNSDQSVTRTASVCDPRSTTGATGGYCTRPSS